jgi:tRNA(fMet)-specific endonuclease VapC
MRLLNEPVPHGHGYAHVAGAWTTLPAWSHFSVLSFSEQAIARFEQLRSMRLNVGLMDLRVAAIALEHRLTVATRNQRDFGRVPRLNTVDWSV